MSGIFRDVYLWSPPEQHVRDFEVHTDLDGAYRDATLRIRAKLANASAKAAKVTVTATLDGVAGKPATSTVEIGAQGRERQRNSSIPVANPRKWSAETPEPVQASAHGEERGGATLEVIPQMSASARSRSATAASHQRQAVLVKGVNRHEHDEDTAKYVTVESMIRTSA